VGTDIPEADEISQEAVVPVHDGYLAVACVKGSIEKGLVDGIEALEVVERDVEGDVEPYIMGEGDGHCCCMRGMLSTKKRSASVNHAYHPGYLPIYIYIDPEIRYSKKG